MRSRAEATVKRLLLTGCRTKACRGGADGKPDSLKFEVYEKLAGATFEGDLELSCALKDIQAQYKVVTVLGGVPYELLIREWKGGSVVTAAC